MKPANRRKCPCCNEFYRVDPRNIHHQKYCSKPACRKASKAASQRLWLSQPGNQNYFRGPENVARVRTWRADHPGYGKGRSAKRAHALQDHCRAQAVESKENSANLISTALQDVLSAQPLVLIGLIAHLSGSALQDDIDRSTRKLLKLGGDILGGRSEYDNQTDSLFRTTAPGTGPVQLDRSPAGP